jgi:hypothetical protein
MSREIRGAGTGTLYARIISPAGLWWNGATFEAYNAANLAAYANAMTQDGASGLYFATMPALITTAGAYDYFVYQQAGASPAESDLLVTTGKVDWTGSAVALSNVTGMTAPDFLAYLLRRGFKRTDKSAEIYENTTDAIQEMCRRFEFEEMETEKTTTDTITVAGDFKLSNESDFGILQGVVLQDGTTAVDLDVISWNEFRERYPDINVTSDTGYPKHACAYGGNIYIGPIPDAVTYTYRLSYSKRAGTITAATASVPFTGIYRDVLAENVLMRLYRDLEESDKAASHEAAFEKGFLYAMRRENKNSKAGSFCQKPTNF